MPNRKAGWYWAWNDNGDEVVPEPVWCHGRIIFFGDDKRNESDYVAIEEQPMEPPKFDAPPDERDEASRLRKALEQIGRWVLVKDAATTLRQIQAFARKRVSPKRTGGSDE